MMNSRQLYHFFEVSEAGSISSAARKIGVTQPALTRSIKQLETTLQVSLLERRPNGVVLTPEGRILARRVKLMNLEYQHALAEIYDRNQGVKGRLRLSAGPSWITHFLPKILAEYHDLFPEVRVTLTQGPFASQFASLLAGDCEAICGTLDFLDHSEVIKEYVMDGRYTVFAREGHPISSRSKASPKELASYPWVILADDPVSSSWIGAYFEAHGLAPPHIAIETTTLGSLSILRHSDFLTTFAFDSEKTMQAFGLKRINHEGTFWEFPAGIARRRAGRPSPALRAFQGLVHERLGITRVPMS
jgi:DNA-binding transcriptional LysR family regulator